MKIVTAAEMREIDRVTTAQFKVPSLTLMENAGNYAMQLLVTNAIAKDPRYAAAALENLHYLLGRNALGLCFVTRVGWNSVRHPHHRPRHRGQVPPRPRSAGRTGSGGHQARILSAAD